MMVSRSLRQFFFCLAGVLLLSSCNRVDASRIDVVVIGQPQDPFQEGRPTNPAARLVRASTAEGLVAFDEEGRVVPALADRWIVTDDGRSYIFRLRDGTWRGGAGDLTARSAKVAFDAQIRKVRKTSLALDLKVIDDIRVMAGRVIEIRLKHAMPNLLQLLAQPEMGLVYEDQTGGPMTVVPDGETAIFNLIDPAGLGLPELEDWSERTRVVALRSLPGEAAIKAFNDGEADIVLGGRIEDFPRTSSVGILRGTIQLDPVTGLFGLQVMNDEGFLAEPVNREAIALALDRDALIAPFGLGGWNASTRVVAPGLDGDIGTIGERWPEQSLEDRRSVASARVDAWLANAGATDGEASESGGSEAQSADPAGPSQGVSLSIWLPPGPGSDILFRGLSGDLAAIGITARRAEEDEPGDLRLIDTVARYPLAAWFLNQLSCVENSGLCSKDVDSLVATASASEDPAERSALLAEAEAEITADNVFIPLGPPIRWSLVRGDVNGFATNPTGWHPLMPLAWLPR